MSLLSIFRIKIFKGSTDYWNSRYLSGGNSGAGSYTKFAEFKANLINKFVEDNQIQNVVEFGSGDGNQLTLAKYRKYTGYDVSNKALEICRKRFRDDPTKTFKHLDDYNCEPCDLALSLDVIYHLVEDSEFERHMFMLFSTSEKHVIIYSSNSEDIPNRAKHVRHRCFTNWIERNMRHWKLEARIENAYPYTGDSKTGSFADFFIFRKHSDDNRSTRREE